MRVIVPSLCILLRLPAARSVFVEHGGVGYVTKLLKLSGSSDLQLTYELCFCLWTLSFAEEHWQDFQLNSCVPVLAEQVMRDYVLHAYE